MKRAMLALFCLALTAATQDIPRTSESIDVSIVNVDVFVSDRSGQRVHGLTKDDFEIYEDGKLQPVTNFAEYVSNVSNESVSVEGGATEPVVESHAAPRQRRTIVVFVDRFQVPGSKSDSIFSELKTILHRAVRPGDAVTIVSWTHRLFTRIPFTDDLRRLDTTLDAMAKERHYDTAGDYNRIDEEEQWEKEVEEFMGGGNGGPSDSERAVEKMPTLEALNASTGEYYDMKAKVKALNALIESISGIEGQKSIIFLSRRFSMLAGREYLTDRRQLLHPPGGYELSFNMRKDIEATAANANAHGVTMYMLYPAGLGNSFVPDASSRRVPTTNEATIAGHEYMTLDNEVQALQYVAEQTGGVAAWGADIIKLLPRIEEDFASYYSLAYRAPTRHQDRARKLVVKVKNRAYTVRARRQFTEQSDDTKMKNRVVAMLFKEPEASTIPLRVHLGEAKPKARGTYLVPVVVEIPVQSLVSLEDAKGRRGAFTVYVASGDILGAISDVTRNTQPFTIDDVQRAKSGKFGYRFELLADARTNRISIGVCDEISKEYGLQRIELPHAVR